MFLYQKEKVSLERSQQKTNTVQTKTEMPNKQAQ